MVLPTGIGALDRKLGGGLPEGSLVAVEAPPEAQREPLLCAGVNLRPSMYFATVRTEAAVRKQFERSPVEAKIRRLETVQPDKALETIPPALDDLAEGEDVIVDVVDPIERDLDDDAYAAFLNDLTERLDEIDGVGYLHGLAHGETSHHRALTLDVADVVWELEPIASRTDLDYILEIPKASGLRLEASDRRLELAVGRDVYVDTTRNI